MMRTSGARKFLMREPVAATKTRQVRVMSNTLANMGFLYLLFDCVTLRLKENWGFAQSALINVVNHVVVSGL